MDKYQEDLMMNVRFEVYDLITKKYSKIVYENNVLKIMQNEDITHNEYLVYLAGNNRIISKVEAFENARYKELSPCTPIQFLDGLNFYRSDLVFKVDFNSCSITKIKLYFVDDLADPLEIPIEYFPADKEKYIQKKECERVAELIKKMNVTDACGDNLVTIKFQNCSDCVARTQITLFNDELQLMGVFKVEEGMLYKSIINLAYGKYYYKVAQYNENSELIVETDYIKFSLSRPNHSGRGLIRPCS